MTITDVVNVVTDLGTTGVLLLILWQGLKRFDMLLQLVITLAARSQLTADEIERIRQQVAGSNGKQK